jgi:hypothetical protein
VKAALHSQPRPQKLLQIVDVHCAALGLTARQFVCLAVGASLAYELWDLSAGLPAGVPMGSRLVART